MQPVSADAERSVRRSDNRLRLLLLLSSLGEAYLSQLARASGVSANHVRWCLHGRPPWYSEALSLLALGLARVEDRPAGRVYVITAKGRRKARSLTAAFARSRRGALADLAKVSSARAADPVA